MTYNSFVKNFVSLPILLFTIFLSCGKTLEEKKQESNKLFSDALSLYNRGEVNKAESIFINAFDIEKDIGRHEYLGHIQLYLGLINFQRAKYYKSLDFYGNALSEYEMANDLKNQSIVLNNISGIYGLLNQYENSIKNYLKSINISRITMDKESQATAFGNIALAYDALENYDKALEYFNKANIINKVLNDDVGVALNLNNIGELFYHQEKYDESWKYFNEAFVQSNKLRNFDLQATSLKNIGNILKINGKDEEALNVYYNSLIKARLASNHELEREILYNIGDIYYRTYQYDKAKIAFEEALNIAYSRNDKFSEVFFLINLANSLRFLSTSSDASLIDQSEKHYENALSISKEIEFSLGEALAYFNLANIYEVKDLKSNAIEYYKKSVEIYENLFDAPKNSFLSEFQKKNAINYSSLIYFLLLEGKNEEAFNYLEKQNNKFLSIFIKTQEIEFSDKESERIYKDFLNLMNELSSLYFINVFELSKQSKDQDRNRVESLKEIIQSKTNEFLHLKDELTKRSDVFKLIVGSSQISLKEIQTQIPDNALVIEYFNRDTSLYIFTISKNIFDLKKVSISSEIVSSQKNLYLKLIKREYNNEKKTIKKKSEKIDLIQDLSNTLNTYFFKPIEDKMNNLNNLYIVSNDTNDNILYKQLTRKNFVDPSKMMNLKFINSFSSLIWMKSDLKPILEMIK